MKLSLWKRVAIAGISLAGGEWNQQAIAQTPVAGQRQTSFQQVAEQLDQGGSFFFYAAMDQWLAELSTKLASVKQPLLSAIPTTPQSAELPKAFDLLIDAINVSGLQSATGIGMSTITVGPGMDRQKIFIHHKPGQGQGYLWSFIGGTPHELDALKLLPAKTAAANFNDQQPALLLEAIGKAIERYGNPQVTAGYQQMLTQAASTLGMPLDEALQLMKGAAGFIITLDPDKQISMPGKAEIKFPTPDIAIVLPLADSRLFDRIDSMTASDPKIIRVEEDGLRMRTIPELPNPLGMALRPSAAYWEKQLIIASNDSLVRDIIAAKAGGGLASKPEFKRLTAGLPTKGNGFAVTMKSFSDALSRYQVEALKADASNSAAQIQMLQPLMTQTAGSSSYMVSSHLENGWLMAANQLFEGERPNGATIIKAIAAAVQSEMAKRAEKKTDIPADDATAVASIAQARKIQAACVQYAGDHAGAFPPTLDALVPHYLPEKAALASPYSSDTIPGYTLTPGLTQDSPPGTVLLEDNQAPGSGKRVLLKVDGTTEIKQIP